MPRKRKTNIGRRRKYHYNAENKSDGTASREEMQPEETFQGDVQANNLSASKHGELQPAKLTLKDTASSPIKLEPRTLCDVSTCTSPLKFNNTSTTKVPQGAEVPIFERLKRDLLHQDFDTFVLVKAANSLRLIHFYDTETTNVKVSLTIRADCSFSISVHNIPLPIEHGLWKSLPDKIEDAEAVQVVLKNISRYEVCTGNSDEDFQDLVSPHAGLSNDSGSRIIAYREGGTNGYVSTIRSVACNLLCLKATSSISPRCSECGHYRGVLRSLRHRRDNAQSPNHNNLLSYKKPHSHMTKEELAAKCQQYKVHCQKLEMTNEKLRSKIRADITKLGECLPEKDSVDLEKLMDTCEKDVIQSFPDENSFQRLFWDQQKKFNSLSNKHNMRWHPMIIKWCLYLQHKSRTAYSSLREMGFINLPSERTLYDYSHYTKGGAGFKPDVSLQLLNEIKEKKLEEDWQKYVGLLQDEIRIKADLVYDRHTGELVGFIQLDDIGNHILEMERNFEDTNTTKHLARYVLVLMVRGIASNLKFPLAHFASGGITADLLYPIIWEGVEILEVSLGLKVLFITCDGASPNRRFFKLHHLPQGIQDTCIYCTPNPYGFDETRYIFFISDVPHLIKTARNCFANSNSHKKTRKLWFHQDISWMHIVQLYEDCIHGGLYNFCPKLTRAHIDLTSYGCMKVRLAAQVLSSTVAHALEQTRGDITGATVKFIRMMNNFFDCLNTRHLYEGRNKLNPNLKPYTRADDERLAWLSDEFLKYFKDWKEAVENRNGQFSKSEKASMLLSYQTLEGFEITVKSIVSCVKYMLNLGAPFILTEVFNQDIIEQHFGHHRAHCGSNTNPTLSDINSNMTRLRVIGSQAISSASGNTKRRIHEQVIDNTSLPKRRR